MRANNRTQSKKNSGKSTTKEQRAIFEICIRRSICSRLGAFVGGDLSSKDIGSMDQYKSSCSNSLSDSLSASPSPSGIRSHSSTSPEKSSPEIDDMLEEVHKEISKRIIESAVVGDESNNKIMCGENFEVEELDAIPVDTRTYEDFKSDIEKKESLLAEILDLNCLKMDHESKPLRDHSSDASHN
ncbi:hypothetical protein SK128_025987, partial [Halocaridina rubra]